MLHAQIGRREEVNSRLLVVESQTANLIPGPSFAHNLGYRCSNCQCEGIFDIYVSIPFQWHQEYPNARCFAPCYRALNIRESRKTPNLQLFQVLGFTPTLGQSGVATPCQRCALRQLLCLGPYPYHGPCPDLHHARGPLLALHQAATHLQMAAVARPQSLAHPQP